MAAKKKKNRQNTSLDNLLDQGWSPSDGENVPEKQAMLSETRREISSAIQELPEDMLEQVVGGGKGGAYYTGYYIGKTVKVAAAGVGIVGGLVAIGVISW